ncbi:hypothetical protein L207DRAFT_593972 [Hyaloscypha variabilis F]|uniref:Uncharacterized protein n=1 Tax=Hyaloscypha variabilis (strain UAMH 11265 / GT02V1 / F) TaxID=1149755 RepID=A0A2J6QRL1_HYAVF|nr:hypothetical protein L207DRAFT_593972 [Hyaloscypha variabilis F]
MKLTSVLALTTSCFQAVTCAPQGTPLALPLLVDFYPNITYGGDKYYAASGPYSTCLGVPGNLESIIKSIKLGPNVKECTFYDDAVCTRVKEKYKVYRKDEPKITLSPVLSLDYTEV